MRFLLPILLAAVAWAQPRNILLILADDLGWADTTLYGKTSLYKTPNIQRLASRGMTFSKAYAAHPLCSPTRSSILTGQNPARTGFTSPAGHIADVRYKPGAKTSGPPHQKSNSVLSSTRIDPATPTVAEVLKKAGYATAHFGKWHLGKEPHSPLECGFDVDIPHYNGPGPGRTYLAPWTIPGLEGEPGEHIEDRMAKEAVTWLKNRDRTKPFFMNYWQFSVHAPFGAKPELIDRYRKQVKRGEAQQCPTYAAMVHSLDDAVGTLLDALEAEGIADDTIIVFYSDNGGNIHCGLEESDAAGETYITAITSNAPLRGGKAGIHEGGIRVPGVVVWPGVTRAGSRSETRIQSNDLYPTLLRMVDLAVPAGHPIDGVDFTDALKGKPMQRGPMFTYVPSYGNTPQWLPPSMAVHHGGWKLIRSFHHGKDGAHEYRLYNLEDDIGEANNVAAAHPETVKAMDTMIDDYIAAAKVIVPLPNPKFDPAQFDASTIGVQAGGLKMPKGNTPPPNKAAAAKKPAAPVSTKATLGWTVRGAAVAVAKGSLRIKAAGTPLLINSKLSINSPAEARLRIRAQTDGEARLQWRTEGQDLFPKTGQTQTFPIKGGAWREVALPLAADGKVVHVRLFLPKQKQTIDIDWIEFGQTDGDPERWDFGN